MTPTRVGFDPNLSDSSENSLGMWLWHAFSGRRSKIRARRNYGSELFNCNYRNYNYLILIAITCRKNRANCNFTKSFFLITWQLLFKLNEFYLFLHDICTKITKKPNTVFLKFFFLIKNTLYFKWNVLMIIFFCLLTWFFKINCNVIEM